MGEVLPLKESEKPAHWLLLDSVDAAIVLIDQAHCILHLNPAAKTLITQAGVQSEHWQGRKLCGFSRNQQIPFSLLRRFPTCHKYWKTNPGRLGQVI